MATVDEIEVVGVAAVVIAVESMVVVTSGVDEIEVVVEEVVVDIVVEVATLASVNVQPYPVDAPFKMRFQSLMLPVIMSANEVIGYSGSA